MLYFDHSTTAGGDDKVIALRLEQGGAAVDAFWVILEQMYRDETPLVFFGNRHANLSLCHRLNADEKTLETWVLAMLEIGLLERDVENPNALTSKRAMQNVKAYREKCETARQNGKKGGRKPTKKPNANQGGNRTQTKAETEGQANKTKQNKGFGLDKPNQKPTASDDAAAAGAAPPSAKSPFCPLCDVKMWRDTQTGRFHCPSCQDAFDRSKAVWR